MPAKHYDHIVVGAGALRAAAAYWLSRGGSRVLVCEQFQPGHPWGSSDDHSRIIRPRP
ncbi:FAD-dependent oxidoreductase [Jatrophihabitans cynanchi]|uniref:FAD-dependent oxidoreductase n=1 Tax=Jatrophihabitans cynanchi TaxID=2944128 RepID=UPI0038B2E9E7